MNWCFLCRSDETSACPSIRPFCIVSFGLVVKHPHPTSPQRCPRRENSKRWLLGDAEGEAAPGEPHGEICAEGGSCGSVAVRGGDWLVV